MFRGNTEGSTRCALMEVTVTAMLSPAGAANGLAKVHYIRAELVQWDYAPGGLVDQCTGQQLDAAAAVRSHTFSEPYAPLSPCSFSDIHLLSLAWVCCSTETPRTAAATCTATARNVEVMALRRWELLC